MNRADFPTIRAMFEAFTDPLLLLDGTGLVLRLNQSARKLFGAAEAGLPVSHLIVSPQVLEAVDLALKGETPQTVELILPDNIDHIYSTTVQPIYFSGRTGTPRVMLTLHDITALRRTERLRVDFLANASHELKTPLASLLGFIETLQGPARDDPQARERFLEIMHAQASRMSRLVQDLLSLARIEFSEHVPPTGQVDLAALARQAIDQLQTRAIACKATLHLTAPRRLPAVTGDADQIMQVMQNLLENALKYSPPGEKVEISLRQDGSTARFAVRDHGRGIPREHLPRLTERFYRIDEGRSRQMGGTGLGLSIVKHIVNRHRGRLHIESELGQGSTFEVILPLAPE